MSYLRTARRTGRRFENPVPTELGGFSMAAKVLPLYLTNKEERVPRERLGPFRTDRTVYAEASTSGLRVTWFGHSSMLVEMDGVRLLLDPVWDERAFPVQWGGPRRFFPPTIALDELPALDAVMFSHDHYDHLGSGTVRQLAGARPELRWIVPLGVGAELRKFGVAGERITELDWTESTVVMGREPGQQVTATALPARHFSGRSAFNRFETLWASYALKGRTRSMYFGADSGEWEGFAEIGKVHGPFDLTALEIGAFHELWKGVHMGPDGAARMFRAMGGTGLLMPVHWGMFDLALHGWREPMERMTAVADTEKIALWSPELGRPSEVIPGQALRSAWWRRG